MTVPPVLTGLPLVGLAPRMLRDPLGVIADAHTLGPAVPLAMARLPPSHAAIPPEGVLEVLAHGQRRRFEAMTVLLGDGLAISPTGEVWRRHRRLMQPMFSHRRIAELHPLIVAASEAHIDGPWRAAAATGEPLDASLALRRLTLDIIMRTMLGARLPGSAEALGANLGAVLDFMKRRLLSPLKLPLAWPLPSHRRFQRANTALRSLSAQILRERRERPESSATSTDLIGLMLAARDQETGEDLGDGQITDEIMTIVLAGHETTATALVWTLLLLARHPHALARVRTEVDAVLGARSPAVADLAGLGYTRGALFESMRLYPPVWAMFREFNEPRRVCGVDLPANMPIIVCPWMTHRLPAQWPDPGRFEPERFAPGAGSERPRHAYFPFGAGPHLCIGSEFAVHEALVVLAQIVQRFDYTVVGEVPPAPRVVFTLTPRAPVRIHLRSRAGAALA